MSVFLNDSELCGWMTADHPRPPAFANKKRTLIERLGALRIKLGNDGALLSRSDTRKLKIWKQCLYLEDQPEDRDTERDLLGPGILTVFP